MSKLIKVIEELKKQRRDIWSEMPDEIRDLLRRKRPAGPIIYAEGETRTLHELLFACYDIAYKNKVDLKSLKEFTRVLLQFYRGKLDKWYGLRTIAVVLERAEEAFSNAESMENYCELVKELILFVGRVNMWLDLLIPWQEMNELLKKG